MTIEQLEKANAIKDQIERCELNIKRVSYTQIENFVPRITELHCHGTEAVEIPDSLFRVIGKLILSEHNQNLIELKNEFNSL
jgi:hypothetical protein